MNKKLNILLLSNMFPSSHSKTYGIFVKNQADQLTDRGHNVNIIAIKDPRKGKVKTMSKYFVFFSRTFIHLLLHRKKYNIIHIHYIFPTGIIPILLKKIVNAKIVVTAHGGDIDQMRNKNSLSNFFTKKILHDSDYVIAVGEKLFQDIQEFSKIPNSKISVMSMGVDRSIFNPINPIIARESIGIQKSEEVILFVGNLIRTKGIDELIKMMKILKHNRPKAHLYMIGEAKDVDYYNEILENIKELNNITIVGAIEQKNLKTWFSSADIFVLPSHIEGLGLVVVEAMACKTPVIASDVGGLSYLINNENGIKTPPKNADVLAENVVNILSDPILRSNIIDASQSTVSVHDINRIVTELEAIYYRL